jgi:hypothetical protein
MIAAVLLLYGAGAMAANLRQEQWTKARITRMLEGALLIGGIIAGFFAIYLFIATNGWIFGILYLFGCMLLVDLANRFLDDAIRSVLGLVAIGAGFVSFTHTFL